MYFFFINLPNCIQTTFLETVGFGGAWRQPYWIALCSYSETGQRVNRMCSSAGSGPYCSYPRGSGTHHRGDCWRGRYFSSYCYMKGWLVKGTWPTVSPVYDTSLVCSETKPEKRDKCSYGSLDVVILIHFITWYGFIENRAYLNLNLSWICLAFYYTFLRGLLTVWTTCSFFPKRSFYGKNIVTVNMIRDRLRWQEFSQNLLNIHSTLSVLYAELCA